MILEAILLPFDFMLDGG